MEKNISKALNELPDDYEHLLQYSNKKLPWILRYGTILIAFLLGIGVISFFLFFKI